MLVSIEGKEELFSIVLEVNNCVENESVFSLGLSESVKFVSIVSFYALKFLLNCKL